MVTQTGKYLSSLHPGARPPCQGLWEHVNAFGFMVPVLPLELWCLLKIAFQRMTLFLVWYSGCVDCCCLQWGHLLLNLCLSKNVAPLLLSVTWDHGDICVHMCLSGNNCPLGSTLSFEVSVTFLQTLSVEADTGRPGTVQGPRGVLILGVRLCL